MIGFDKDLERELIEATSPFTFWRVGESRVMRFLKLIGCDNGKIGRYAALVKERNDAAHTNGNIFVSTRAALDQKIWETLRVAEEIQTHSAPTVQRCYSRFLDASGNSEDREYPDNADQIREALIHAHYFSQKDIEICAAYDIVNEFDTHLYFSGIESLHKCLRDNYDRP